MINIIINMEVQVCDNSSGFECGLLCLATETLLEVVSYLTAYERLCLRVTCKRFYSILSDSRVWHTLVWKDCRKRDSDCKALRLAVKLSASNAQSISILYPRDKKIAKFLSQIDSCKQVRYLTLSGNFSKVQTLEKLFSNLPCLSFLSITVRDDYRSFFSTVWDTATENLKILRIVAEDCYSAVYNWHRFGYTPPYLQVCSSIPCKRRMVPNLLDILSKSDHPAKLSFYPECSSAAGNLVYKYPLLEIVLYPNIEVATCAICSLSPKLNTPCVALCNGILSDSSEEPCEYISATYFPVSVSTLPGHLLPLLPPTIQSLDLAQLGDVISDDLSSISECCPNLRCLNISGCSKALLSLRGLADIGERCVQLTSLNIKAIYEVESVATLWEALASMKKLRHLAINERLLRTCMTPQLSQLDEHSLSIVGNSVRRMNLTAFEISSFLDVFIQLDILLPAFHWLKHLRIFGCVSRLTDILQNIPNLTHFVLLNDGLGFPQVDGE